MLRPHLTCLVLASLLASGCRSLEDSLVFHPVRNPAEQLPPNPVVQDVTLQTADSTRIHARWCVHPEATGAIIYCPGNAGNLEGRARAVKDLHDQLNESVLIFDYPGFGQSGGQPSEAGCYAAAAAAYRWLVHNRHIPPERIILYGESLGGGVAVDLASRQPHRALVLARTFTSIPDVAQAHFSSVPVHWLMHNRFNSVAKIKDCRRPVFIAQGERDTLIPAPHAAQLLAAAGGPARLFVLKGLRHNDPPGPDYYEALRQFLATDAP
jgi:fermentation-respiration switch protein FrsA (DUF1100 family)